MVFLANIPQPGDKLKNSQGQLLTNNQQLDTSFGVDHYTFSNATADNGKHNVVTTPIIVGSVDPTTAANEPKFYCLTKGNANLQFSRGGSDAIPTPVTSLHSSGAVAIPANIFDFSGLTRAMAMLYAFGTPATSTNKAVYFAYYDGTTLFVNQINSGVGLAVGVNGSILRINSGTNVYWTLDFLRMQ